MKPVFVYGAIFFLTLLVASTLVLVAAVYIPNLFPSGESAAAKAPSERLKEPEPSRDTEIVQAQPDIRKLDPPQALKASNDTSAVVSTLQDSLKSLTTRLAEERKRVELLNQKIASERLQQASVDSTNAVKAAKDKAKLLESMGAEEAARIIQNMNQTEAKEVILLIKKRQAGKILAQLEPAKAAQIMR